MGFAELLESPASRLDAELRWALLGPKDTRRGPEEPPSDVVVSADGLRDRRDALVRRPERVIGFAGAIDVETARRTANRMLVPVLREPRALPGPTTAPLPEGGPGRHADARLDGISTAWIGLARIGLSTDDPALAATYVAEAVARDRVRGRVRSELGATYSVSSDGLASRHPDVYRLVLTTAPDKADEVVAEVQAILAAIAAGEVTQEEVNRVVERELARLELAHQSPSQLLQGAMARELHGFRGLTASGWESELREVDLEAVKEAAGRFFQQDAFATAILRPEVVSP